MGLCRIDLEELLPGLNGRVEVAHLRLRETGDFAEPADARLVIRLFGSGGAEEKITKVAVFARLLQVRLQKRERVLASPGSWLQYASR